LETGADLYELMRTRIFRDRLRRFSVAAGVAPDEASHLAVIVVAVACREPDLIRFHFPEMVLDPSLDDVLDRTTKRSPTRRRR
jgi:hypothetical protein